MIDSYGDGWNGAELTVAGQTVTLESGSNGTATVCIDMSVCNSITVSEGAWPSEVSWAIGELEAGAPYEGQIGDCGDVIDVPGCTDESALNYNSDATLDDGSCEYESVECDYELLTVSISQSVLDSLPKLLVRLIAIENVLSAFISAATASELLDPDPQLEE